MAMQRWQRSCPGLRQTPPSTRWPQSPKDLPWDARLPAPMEESVLWRSSQVHLRFDIHTGSKLVIAIFARLQNDLNRNSLDNLYVISSRIFGWQQAEDRARSSRDAVNMTVVCASVRVELDRRFLANTHVFELGLFEIRGDPHLIQGNHSEHLLPRIDIQSDDNLLRNLPGYGRKYLGVSQIQLRLLNSGPFLVNICHRREGFGAR